MRDDVTTILRAEMGEEVDPIEVAAALVRTGLVNSTGSNQRFVEAVADSFPDELRTAILAGYRKEES